MDDRTAKLALEEIRHIEATINRIRTDVREMLVIMDRTIATTQRALGQFASSPGESPHRIELRSR